MDKTNLHDIYTIVARLIPAFDRYRSSSYLEGQEFEPGRADSGDSFRLSPIAAEILGGAQIHIDYIFQTLSRIKVSNTPTTPINSPNPIQSPPKTRSFSELSGTFATKAPGRI